MSLHRDCQIVKRSDGVFVAHYIGGHGEGTRRLGRAYSYADAEQICADYMSLRKRLQKLEKTPEKQPSDLTRTEEAI